MEGPVKYIENLSSLKVDLIHILQINSILLVCSAFNCTIYLKGKIANGIFAIRPELRVSCRARYKFHFNEIFFQLFVPFFNTFLTYSIAHISPNTPQILPPPPPSTSCGSGGVNVCAIASQLCRYLSVSINVDICMRVRTTCVCMCGLSVLQ